MKPEKIYYQKNFPVAQFIFETVGFGITLEEGEDPEDALNEAKRLVHEYHYKNQQPSVIQHAVKVPSEIPNTHVQPEKQPKVILTPAQKKEKQLQETKIAISTVTDIKVLESYKLIAKNNPELQEAYNNKEKELKQ